MSTLGIVSRNRETNEMRGSIALLGRRNPIGIEIVPNPAKRSEAQPDFRIYSGANELGAGWVKVSRETGKPFYANLGRAAGQDDDDVLAVIVNEAA